MSNSIVDPINNRRVLERFLKEPTKWVYYDDLKEIRFQTGESEIRKALQSLVGAKILEEANPRGKPASKEDIMSRRKNYCIKKDIHVFGKLFQGYSGHEIDLFLRSNYVDYVAKNNGFAKVFNVIEPDLERFRFRRIASAALLKTNSAIAEEFEQVMIKFQTDIMTLIRSQSQEKPKGILSPFGLSEEIEGSEILSHIGMLRKLDPLFALPFYHNVAKGLIDLYIILASESKITEGMWKFLYLDTYLSPLTSFPINGPKWLLFSRPFERLYEDAYLFNEWSVNYFKGRTQIIYHYFSDFLFELFKDSSNQDENDLKVMTKDLIFHWNVASTRFDFILMKFEKIKKDYGKRVCHLHLESKEMAFQLYDLIDGRMLLNQSDARNILAYGSIPRIITQVDEDSAKTECMKEPYTQLRPCYFFRETPLKSELVPFDQIYSDLINRLADYKEAA